MSSSYWCYRCSQFVRVRRQDVVICPDCDSGFVEEIEHPPRSVYVDARRRRFPGTAMYMIGPRPPTEQNPRPPLPRRSRRSGGDRSPFNPVIVLRGSPDRSGQESGENRGFELYYDDGAGSGLRPLPPSMSEFLLGSGFDRLLEQLSQIEINGVGRLERPPASKAAIDSLPTIEIDHNHLSTEPHCAICMEAFELCTEAREMPCKHIYHSDCILPWLALRNSCPVCRHELPADSQNSPPTGHSLSLNDEDNVGLTIWRLPGGGFAVGRFSGGRRGAERELPVVYTEMDGGFNNGGTPRRISWTYSENNGREASGIRRMLSSLFGCFRGGVQSESSNSSPGESRHSRESSRHGESRHSPHSAAAVEPQLVRRSFSTRMPGDQLIQMNGDQPSRTRRTWSMDVNIW